MDIKQQLEVNMKAARLLGKLSLHRRPSMKTTWDEATNSYINTCRYCDKCKTTFFLPDSDTIPQFTDPCTVSDVDLFTNAQDLLDVVKRLGKAHGIGIDYYDFSGEDTTLKSGWGYTENHADSGVFKVEFNTYEEAVAEAVIEVSDE